MACILIAGRNRNHLKHMGANAEGSISVVGGDVSALFPLAALYDDDVKPFQFGSRASNRYIQLDNNALSNGGFEAGTAGATPPGWTVRAGTFVTNTSSVDSGTKCGMLGGNGHVAYQVMLRPAGEAFTCGPRARGNGAGIEANVRVVNLDTGYTLKTDGTWGLGYGNYLIQGHTGTSYDGAPINGVVQNAAECGSDLARIMFLVDQSGGGAGNTRYDTLQWIPHIDFWALIGHNVPPSIAVRVLRSPTGAFGGEEVIEATIVPSPRNMYYAGSVLRTERYWRLLFVGQVGNGSLATPDPAVIPIGLTELFVGQKTVLTQAHNWDYLHGLDGDQGRTRIGGLTRVYSRNPAPVERFALDFENTTTAAYEELRDLVYASQMGSVRSVLVPDDTRRDIGYGNFGPSAEMVRRFLTVWGTPLTLDCMPAACFVS